jgi:hypothetical protein
MLIPNDPKQSIRLYKQNGQLWFDYNGGSDKLTISSLEMILSGSDLKFDNIIGDAGVQKYVAWNGGTGLIDIDLPGIVKTGDTEFTVKAGSGNFLDLTDPSNPVITHIHWNDITGITDLYAATNLRTAVAIDINGDVVQFEDTIPADDRRTNIPIGLLTHTDGATITQTNLIPATAFDPIGKLTDLCAAVKFINEEGNLYDGASAVDTSLKVSSGITFACDRNYTEDKDSPNVNQQDAIDPILLFFTGWRDGAGGGSVGAAATVDTTKYDDGTGTLATLDDGFWVTHRLFRSSTTGSTLLIFGQATHRGRSEALTQMTLEDFDRPPGAEELILRGYLTVRKGATNLQDRDTSVFTPANKYGTGPTNRPTNGFDISSPVFKSESLTSRGVTAGTYYLHGDIKSEVTDITLTQASTTLAYGTANIAYGMRPFAVFAGAGTVDTGQVGLRVTGTTFTDAGVRNGSDTQVVTDDITTLTLNQYLETAKKFIGQVIYELYVVSGSPTTYSLTFNYGLIKYEDFGNRDFMLTDLEISGLGGANDSSAELILLKQSDQGWTYHATAFTPGGTEIADMNDYYSTEDQIADGDPFHFKLDSTALNVPILGSQDEGVLLKVVAGANNTYQILNSHIGAQV